MDLGIAGEGSTWKATPFNTGAWPLALPQHPESAFHATGMVPLLPFAEGERRRRRLLEGHRAE